MSRSLRLSFLLLFALGVVPCKASVPDAIENLIVCGRSHFLLGDLEAADAVFCKVLSQDPCNKTASSFRDRIAHATQSRISNNKSNTRSAMLESVDLAWQRPQICDAQEQPQSTLMPPDSFLERLRSIHIPRTNFENTPLSQAISTLAEYAVANDYPPYFQNTPGVNFVLMDPDNLNPSITLLVHNLPLDQLIEIVAESVNFRCDVENEMVIFRHAQTFRPKLVTDFFPISRATMIKLTGFRSLNNPHYAEPPHPTQHDEELALKNFFQRAGIPFDSEFDGPRGAEFAFDGTQIIVTQTSRNLEKIRNVLVRYNQAKQVEIEAKFMEVQQGVLEELGFKWNIASGNNTKHFYGTFNDSGDITRDNLRTLSSAFGNSAVAGTSAGKVLLDGEEITSIANIPPLIPNAINLGIRATPIASILGILGGWQINSVISALEQHTGTDLMSAPKVTVLSGRTANITIAQTLRYPESFGDIQSAVGSAGSNPDSSAAGVTITAGTPRNFVEKNVGVEMEVTPTIEADNTSINLRLEPKVTEFEGFVEYGGESIALSGNNAIHVPPGFFQPIFSKREISTEVTIADGATVIMGGLTREAIKHVSDKVPVLGNIPVLGRLFRSKGETSQKRNLLIFVTGNLVTIAGTPANNKHAPIVPSSSLFQNPTTITPSGAF